MPRVLRFLLSVVFSILLALVPVSLRAQDADGPKGSAQSREKYEKNFERGENGDEENFIRKRQQWFNDRRAYPLKHLPAGIRQRAIKQRDVKLAAESAARARIASPAQVTQPQWVQIGPQPVDNYYGVSAGRVTALAVDLEDPKIVYAGGAEGGVWKTTDGGATWIPLTDGQPSLAVGSITLDPNNSSIVYVGTGEENFSGDSYYGSGVLKSTDAGATWTQICGPFCGPDGSDGYFNGGARIGQMSVKPGNSLVVLAAVEFSGFDGIYRSTNGGASWAQVISGQGPGTAVFFDPTNGNVAYAATSNGGVFKSADGGNTWSASNGAGPTALPNPSGGRVALALAPSSTMVLYAAIANTSTSGLLGFYKSTTGGTSWTQLTNTPNYCRGQCWYDDTIGVSPVDPNFVIVGGSWAYTPGSSAALRSLDGGVTWTDFSAEIHPDAHAMAFTSDGSVLYTGNDGGVWSTNAPAAATIDWVSLNPSLALTEFYPGISIDPGNVNHTYAGTQDNGTNKYSGSVTWPTVDCGDGGATAIDFAHPNVVYTGCITATLDKSTDDGATFNDATAGIVSSDRVAWVPPLAMDPENSQTLYFGTYRVYQTTNAAGIWVPISGDLTAGVGTLSTLAVAPTDSNTVYSGSDDGQVYVTRNALSGSGASWTNVTTSGLPNRTVDWIAVDPTMPTTAYVVYNGFSGFGDNLGHVFKTTNAGGAWTDISSDLPNTPVDAILVDPDSPETLFIGTDIGAFYTNSGGASWSTLGTGLPNVVVVGLALHNGSRTLRAATHGRSVWDLNITSLLPAPSISSLSPTSTPVGNAPITLTVNGLQFDSSSIVHWNGTPLTTSYVSSSQLTAVVPGVDLETAGTASVTVFNAGSGKLSNAATFTIVASVLQIISISPNYGAPAASIEITGTDFGATQGNGSVTVGGAPSRVVSWSNTAITIQVPSRAATGNIVVTAVGKASNGAPFTFYPYPAFTGISPVSGPVGARVIITGTGLLDGGGNSVVTFNGTPATILSETASSIKVDVPFGATTGPISVRANGDTVKSSIFTVSPSPQITSVNPNYGAPAALIRIAGTDFGATQGNGSVTVGGAPSRVVSWTNTAIAIQVPSRATAGNIVVSSDDLLSNGAAFTFYPYPAVTDVSPITGPVGTTVTLTGTGLLDGGGKAAVTFNGTPATIISQSSSSIQANVPVGATTGPVSVFVNGDTVKAPGNFYLSVPQINALNPSYGAPAALINIIGTNFGATQSNSYVTINGAVCGVTAWSDISITIRVPSNASTGNLVVRVGRESSNGAAFTFHAYPAITSVSPGSGAVGTPVTITGSNLLDGGNNATVTFNGIPAAIVSDTASQIQINVPIGATSGRLLVRVNGVTLIGLGNFAVTTPPHAASYDVGPDYYATAEDFLHSSFITTYQDASVRAQVLTQLQGIADRGATVVSMRIWFVTEPGTSNQGESWRATFPMSGSEQANLHTYVQDVAAIKGAGGNSLRLDIGLFWLGAADYTTGSPSTGLGDTPISAATFTTRVGQTTDSVLAAITNVKRSDGTPVVDTVYMEGEVQIGAKANQEWFMTTHYPRFVSKVSAAGFRPSVYFIVADTQANVLQNDYFDADFPILNNHRSMFWVYRTLNFMSEQHLPIPPRIDFSYYVPSTGATYPDLLTRVLNDADATLPSLGATQSYGIAETYYFADDTQRRAFGQAFATEAVAKSRLHRVTFWTTPDGGGEGVDIAYPFAIADYLPSP